MGFVTQLTPLKAAEICMRAPQRLRGGGGAPPPPPPCLQFPLTIAHTCARTVLACRTVRTPRFPCSMLGPSYCGPSVQSSHNNYNVLPYQHMIRGVFQVSNKRSDWAGRTLQWHFAPGEPSLCRGFPDSQQSWNQHIQQRGPTLVQAHTIGEQSRHSSYMEQEYLLFKEINVLSKIILQCTCTYQTDMWIFPVYFHRRKNQKYVNLWKKIGFG